MTQFGRLYRMDSSDAERARRGRKYRSLQGKRELHAAELASRPTLDRVAQQLRTTQMLQQAEEGIREVLQKSQTAHNRAQSLEERIASLRSRLGVAAEEPPLYHETAPEIDAPVTLETSAEGNSTNYHYPSRQLTRDKIKTCDGDESGTHEERGGDSTTRALPLDDAADHDLRTSRSSDGSARTTAPFAAIVSDISEEIDVSSSTKLEMELKAQQQIDATTMTTTTTAITTLPTLSEPSHDDVTDPRQRAFLDAMSVKRGQYAWRIATLRSQSAALGEEYVLLMEKRNALRKVLHNSDIRRRELSAELNALDGFPGRFIESTVFHGKVQRFETRRLRDLLSLELAELWDALTAARKGIVEVAVEMEQGAAARSAVEESIRERCAALRGFDHNFGARGTMFRVLFREASSEGAGRAFRTWREFVEINKRGRAALRHVVQATTGKCLASAWSRWQRFMRLQRVAEGGSAEKGDADDAVAAGARGDASSQQCAGVGELMLSYTLAQRTAVAEDSMTLLSWLRRLDIGLSANDAGMHERLAVRELPPLAGGNLRHTLDGPAKPRANRRASITGLSDGGPLSTGTAGSGAGAGLVLHGDGVTPALGPAYDLTQRLMSRAAAGGEGATSSFSGDGEYIAYLPPPPRLALEDGAASTSTAVAVLRAHSRAQSRGPQHAHTGALTTSSGLPPAAADVLAAASTVPGRDADAALAAVVQRAQRAERLNSSPAQRAAALAGAEHVRTLGAAAVNDPSLKPAIDRFLKLELDRAETLLGLGDPGACLAAAKRCEVVYGYRKDADGLLAVYRLLSRLLEKLARLDLASVHWGRCAELAKETGNPLAVAEAAEGAGRCLAGRGEHGTALLRFNEAEGMMITRNDVRARSRVQRLQLKSLRLLGRTAEADAVEAEVVANEGRLASVLSDARTRLAELQRAVYGLGLQESHAVGLEICGASLPLLRQQERFLRGETRKLRAVWRVTRWVRERESGAARALRAELDAANATGADRMVSFALPAYYGGGERERAEEEWEGPAPAASSEGETLGEELPIGELRERLAEALGAASADAAEAERELLAVRQRHANIRGDLGAVKAHILAEGGALSRGAHAGRPLRAVALNAANRRANDVMGLRAGAAPRFAVVADASVLAFSTLDGTCVASFGGDAAKTPFTVGHSGPVTCMCVFGSVLYTGGQDCTVRGWDMDAERGYGKRGPVEAAAESEERIRADAAMRAATARATATAAAAAALVASSNGHHIEGSNVLPMAVVVPHLTDPEEIRRRRAGALAVMIGHEAPVMAVAAHRQIVISGGADSIINMWNPTTGACLRKLRGHTLSVTALALDELTFATGGADHGVRMWAIDAPTPRNFARSVSCRWRSEEHEGAITALACVGRDVASGSALGEIILWNDVTGAPLRKLTGVHGGRSVIGIQFDAMRLVSIGADETLIVWDVLSGQQLQSFTKPHGSARISALQFDDTHLMTVGADRSMRVWVWKGAIPVPRGREIVAVASDTFASIARAHNVRGKQLLKWNRIPAKSVREAAGCLREGMRLIVSELVDRPGGAAVAAVAATADAVQGTGSPTTTSRSPTANTSPFKTSRSPINTSRSPFNTARSPSNTARTTGAGESSLISSDDHALEVDSDASDDERGNDIDAADDVLETTREDPELLLFSARGRLSAAPEGRGGEGSIKLALPSRRAAATIAPVFRTTKLKGGLRGSMHRNHLASFGFQ